MYVNLGTQQENNISCHIAACDASIHVASECVTFWLPSTWMLMTRVTNIQWAHNPNIMQVNFYSNLNFNDAIS